MGKINPLRSQILISFYKQLHVGGSNTNKNDENVKISDEGKKKHITGHIIASLKENGDTKGM